MILIFDATEEQNIVFQNNNDENVITYILKIILIHICLYLIIIFVYKLFLIKW